MSELKVFIEKDVFGPVYHTWATFCHNAGIAYTLVQDAHLAHISIGTSDKAMVKVSTAFYRDLRAGVKVHAHFKNGLICNEEQQPDRLSTAFYLINALQEYGNTDPDEVGRFRYSESFQCRSGTVEQNLVQKQFDLLHAELSPLHAHKKMHRPSRVHLTHDIDTVFGAWYQDGLAALRSGNIPGLFRILFSAAFLKPAWLNMPAIMKIESEYDMRSTFFWLVNKGRLNKRLTNSDYNISDKRIRKEMNAVAGNGFSNGIHKSISPDSFETELRKLSIQVDGNRYHYLRFTLPSGFDEIERAGLRYDTSMGFAEAYGFRNSYGLPFTPYNVAADRPYRFVEIPLHLMDTSLSRYLKTDPAQAFENIVRFFESNRTDAVFTVLWHNNYFTSYKFKGYLELYKKLLAYFYENKFACASSSQLAGEFLIPQRSDR
jgi:peptidoglycan/xylan/chitin deacetylase (PgdA/CDA1 family)